MCLLNVIHIGFYFQILPFSLLAATRVMVFANSCHRPVHILLDRFWMCPSPVLMSCPSQQLASVSCAWKKAASREHWRSVVATAMLKESMPWRERVGESKNCVPELFTHPGLTLLDVCLFVDYVTNLCKHNHGACLACLHAGVQVIGNAVIDCPWQKVVKRREKFEQIVSQHLHKCSSAELKKDLITMLSDTSRYWIDDFRARTKKVNIFSTCPTSTISYSTLGYIRCMNMMAVGAKITEL